MGEVDWYCLKWRLGFDWRFIERRGEIAKIEKEKEETKGEGRS